MRAWVLGAALGAMAIRLAVVALVAPEQQRVFNADSYEYHELARNLLETGELTRDRFPPFTPESIRTPLYPALGAALYAAFGSRYLVVLLANVALAGLVTWLLGRADPRLGPGAALIYALDPTSIVYSALYVAETLFTLCLLVSVLLAARGLERSRGLRWLLLAGSACGVAVLAKPAAAYLPLALLAAVVLARTRRVGLGSAALALLLGYGLVVGPWVWRNFTRLGVAQISSIQEINLLFWNVGVLEGGQSGLSQRGAAQQLSQELEARAGRPFEELTPAERARASRALALERIRAAPLAYLWVHLRGTLATLLDPGRLDYARLLGGLDWGFGFLGVLTQAGIPGVLRALAARPPELLLPLALTALWLGLVYALALRGVGLGLARLRREPLLLVSLVACLYLLLIGGPIGNARFRVPAVPYLALAAALGLLPRERFEGGASA